MKSLKERIKEQKEQALDPENRYFFWERYGRNAKDDNELMLYYIGNGGADAYGKVEPPVDWSAQQMSICN